MQDLLAVIVVSQNYYHEVFLTLRYYLLSFRSQSSGTVQPTMQDVMGPRRSNRAAALGSLQHELAIVAVRMFSRAPHCSSCFSSKT
jgi:hypothetical protein